MKFLFFSLTILFTTNLFAQIERDYDYYSDKTMILSSENEQKLTGFNARSLMLSLPVLTTVMKDKWQTTRYKEKLYQKDNVKKLELSTCVKAFGRPGDSGCFDCNDIQRKVVYCVKEKSGTDCRIRNSSLLSCKYGFDDQRL